MFNNLKYFDGAKPGMKRKSVSEQTSEEKNYEAHRKERCFSIKLADR